MLKPYTLPRLRAGRGKPARRVLAAVLVAALLAQGPVLAASVERAGPFTSSLPNLGDSASDDLSPLAERRIGEEIMRQLRGAGEELDDPEVVEYLNQFGLSLAISAPAGSTFEFFAVKDPSINAFALPGGFIGVHSGLLVAAQSESELASVLAHEMGHVVQRHIARSLAVQRESSLVALGAMALAILAARAGNDQVVQAAAAGGVGFAAQSQLGFSREAEREADRVGFQILQSAGMDTGGMVTFFGRLQQASRYYESAAPAYLRTHPLTSERIADIQNRIREGRYRQRADSPEFQLIRARMRVLQDESGQGLRDVQRLFEEQIKSGQRSSAASAHYGLAMVLVRQRDLPGAQRELDRAAALLPARHAMIDKFAIELAQASPNKANAVVLAQAARSRYPQSRMIASAYADALQQNNRHDDAIAFLRDQLQLYRQEAPLYEKLARSYSAKGNELLEHKSLAENYYLRGNLRAALNQLQMARRVGVNDYYEQSQIDARTRQIQALITERERTEKENPKR